MAFLRSAVTKFHKTFTGIVCLGLLCLSVLLTGVFVVGRYDASLPVAALCAVLFAAAAAAGLVKERVLAYAVGQAGWQRLALSLLVALVFAYAVMEHFFAACFDRLVTGGEGPRAAAQLYDLLPVSPGAKGTLVKLAAVGAAAFGAIAAFFVVMALFRFFSGALTGVWAEYIKRRGGWLQRLARFAAARPEAVIFTVLLVFFFATVPTQTLVWSNVWYVLDYTIGFGSRFLLGAVVNLLFGPYIYDRQVYAFVVLTLLADMALVSWFLGRAIRTGGGEIKRVLAVLAALYVVSPFSPAYLWTDENMGRLDTWLVLLTLLALVAWTTLKNRAAVYVLLGALAVSAMFIHQVYLFIYFPLIFALLCIDTFKYDHIDRKSLWAGLAICAAAGAAFLLNQFFSALEFSTAGELLAHLKNKTDMNLIEQALVFEYYSPFGDILGYAFENFTTGYFLQYELVTLGLLSPFLYIVGRIGRAQLQAAKPLRKSIWYGPEIYILASALAFVPAFAITIDWGRWFAALFSSTIFLVFCLTARGNRPGVDALRAMDRHITKSPDIYVFSIGLLLFLEPFKSMTFMLQARQVYWFVAELAGRVFG